MLLKSGMPVKLVSISQGKTTSEIVLIGNELKNGSSVYGDVVDRTRFNILKCKLEFDRRITFGAKEIDGKSDSAYSAYYAIYVGDGKRFP